MRFTLHNMRHNSVAHRALRALKHPGEMDITTRDNDNTLKCYNGSTTTALNTAGTALDIGLLSVSSISLGQSGWRKRNDVDG